MYYNHFGLTQPPFRITPNTEFFYGGGNRGPILEALLYAISQGEGIIKVTGEVGSGKTMLCSMIPRSSATATGGCPVSAEKSAEHSRVPRNGCEKHAPLSTRRRNCSR